MDIWHATVYAYGNPYDEDRVGREAAQEWVLAKLRELGYTGQVTWTCDDDECHASIRADLTAHIQRRR